MDEGLQSLLVIGFEKLSQNTSGSLGRDFGDVGDISTRPRLWLDLEESERGPKWVFLYADQRDYDNLINDESEIQALICAPIADIQRVPLDGARLWRVPRERPIQWLGHDRDELKTNPYARRLIRILKSGRYAPGSTSDSQISHRKGEGTWPLILKPLRLNDITSDAYRRWTTEEARDQHVWIMPPWRKSNHPDRKDGDKPDGHYFSDQSLAFRGAARAAIGHEEHNPAEPAAVTSMRIADDTALRDLLIEGSGILVEKNSFGATRLALAVHENPIGSRIAQNRAALALGSIPPSVPAWAVPIARAIADDLRSLIPEGEVRKVDWCLDWTSPFVDRRPESRKNPTALVDVQPLLSALVKSVESKDLAKFGAILLDRNARGHNDEGQDLYDEHLLIRDWCRNFWREPWHECDPMPVGSPWVLALVALLENWVPKAVDTGAVLTTHGRFDSGAAFDRLSRKYGLEIIERTPRLVRHAAAPDSDQILLWRLLWPLGTIFQGNTLIIQGGERGRIEKGLVLA